MWISIHFDFFLNISLTNGRTMYVVTNVYQYLNVWWLPFITLNCKFAAFYQFHMPTIMCCFDDFSVLFSYSSLKIKQVCSNGGSSLLSYACGNIVHQIKQFLITDVRLYVYNDSLYLLTITSVTFSLKKIVLISNQFHFRRRRKYFWIKK